MIPELLKKLKPFLAVESRDVAKKTAEAVSRLQAKMFFQNSLARQNQLTEEMKTRLLMEMKHIAPLKSFEFIIACLGDPQPRVRAVALQAAAASNDPRLIEKVLPLVKDPEPVVRKLTYDFLARFPVPKLAEILNKIVEGESYEESKVALITALGEIGSPDSLPVLMAVLEKSGSDALRTAAVESIGKLRL